MDIKKALEYLYSLENRGIRPGLEPVTALLAAIGNPQETYRTVHVAGTNGKGSVAAMTASILESAGYRVGLYTSPHLVDFRERFRIDGAMIPEERLSGLVAGLREHITGEITFFECATALAFQYFQQESVDVAVIETGMGGRLDATNVIIPEVSVITTVALDHERYLGRRIAEIAAEKGGIIKEEGVCVTGVTQAQALEVLESIARRRRARLLKAGRDFTVRRLRGGRRFSFRGMNRTLRDVPLPLAGRYQAGNAALALAAVAVLSERGTVVDDRAIVEGMSAVDWQGRLEVIRGKPMVILDGAHNPAAMSALCATLRRDFVYERLIVLFGVMEDKRYRSMISRLSSIAGTIILTAPSSPSDRRLQFSGLEPWLPRRHGTAFEVVPDAGEALLRARTLAGPADLILVTGSLYLVGEIKALAAKV